MATIGPGGPGGVRAAFCCYAQEEEGHAGTHSSAYSAMKCLFLSLSFSLSSDCLDASQGERLSNDVAWNQMFVIASSTAAVASPPGSEDGAPAAATSVAAEGEGGSHEGGHAREGGAGERSLDGRDAWVLVTVTRHRQDNCEHRQQQQGSASPQALADGGHCEVLGSVIVRMQRGLGALAAGWFPLSLPRTHAHPRVIHPAPLVQVYLRIRYAQVLRQLMEGEAGEDSGGGPGLLLQNPHAHYGELQLQNDGGGGVDHDTRNGDPVAQHDEHDDDCACRDEAATAGRSQPPPLAVTVEVVSSAGIRAPQEYSGGRFWCCASALCTEKSSDLRQVEHVTQDQREPQGAVDGATGSRHACASEGRSRQQIDHTLKEGKALVAQAWSLHQESWPPRREVAEGAVVLTEAATANRSGWASCKMVLPVGEREETGKRGRGADGVTLLVTLHALADGHDPATASSEVARAVVAVQEGLVAEEWCVALAPTHEPLLGYQGEGEAMSRRPGLLLLRVSCVTAKAHGDGDKDGARAVTALNAHALAPPIYGILALCHAMVIAGPPAPASQVMPTGAEPCGEHVDAYDYVLPRGWIARAASSSQTGTAYFHHLKTSQSTSTPPQGCQLAAAASVPPGIASRVDMGAEAADDGWSVYVTIKSAVGLAYCGAHIAGDALPVSPLIHNRGAKVARVRFAASLVFLQQRAVAAADLLALEHLVPDAAQDEAGAGAGGGASLRVPHGMAVRPQAVSRMVANGSTGSGLVEVNETLVLRRALVASGGGLVVRGANSDEAIAGRRDGATVPREVALKGRVVMLLVTVHAQDDAADHAHARMLVPLRPGPCVQGGGVWYPLLGHTGFPMPATGARAPDALPPMLCVEASYSNAHCRPWPSDSRTAHLSQAPPWMQLDDSLSSNALPVPPMAPATSLQSSIRDELRPAGQVAGAPAHPMYSDGPKNASDVARTALESPQVTRLGDTVERHSPAQLEIMHARQVGAA